MRDTPWIRELTALQQSVRSVREDYCGPLSTNVRAVLDERLNAVEAKIGDLILAARQGASMAIKLKDIKPGDTIEYRTGRVYVNSGIPATHSGIVKQKVGYNIEIEDGNWLWWHDIKNMGVRIVEGE